MILRGSSRRRPLQYEIQTPSADKIKNILFIPSACKLHPRPPTLLCGRTGNACTNLLSYLAWYVHTRGIAEAVGSDKTADFRFILCRTHLPRMARATNSCTRKVFFKREESPLKWLLVLLVTQKYDKRKVTLCFYTAAASHRPTHKVQV